MLYSNIELLNEYNKDVPKTWNELLETGKYILEQEKLKNNNTNLIPYNGFFTDLNSFYTIYELVYSYRNTPDIVFPGFGSEEAIEAAKMIKKIKEEISSDEIFKANELINTMAIMNGNGLFIKFWDSGFTPQNYYITPLPGKKEGINTSLTSGYVLDFVIKVSNLYTGLTELYDDSDVCSQIDCEMVKEAQSIHSKMKYVDDLETYGIKVSNIFNEFLFGDRSAEDVLTEIDDITRIYYISLETLS
eukprot:jgi/Orpsp1_1/1174471/evm.model.c7180000050246.1